MTNLSRRFVVPAERLDPVQSELNARKTKKIDEQVSCRGMRDVETHRGRTARALRLAPPRHLYFAPEKPISASRGSYVPSDEALLLPQTRFVRAGRSETFQKADVSFSTPVRACARAEFVVLGK
jgi:hypothetical protein